MRTLFVELCCNGGYFRCGADSYTITTYCSDSVAIEHSERMYKVTWPNDYQDAASLEKAVRADMEALAVAIADRLSGKTEGAILRRSEWMQPFEKRD